MVFRRLMSVLPGLLTRWDGSSIFPSFLSWELCTEIWVKTELYSPPPTSPGTHTVLISSWPAGYHMLPLYLHIEEAPIWAVVIIVYGITIRLLFFPTMIVSLSNLILFMYLLMAVLGLPCCLGPFSSSGEQGPLSSCHALASCCGGSSCCRAGA